MLRLAQARFIFLLFAIITGLEALPTQAGAQTRPTPMGVWGGNPSIQYLSSGKLCGFARGTLGALVADQNGTQYILSVAHLLAISPGTPFASGSNEPIIQPDLGRVGISSCGQITPSLISMFTVANLSTVVPLMFNGPVNTADVAIAKVVPGKVSPSIAGISPFSSVPLLVVKKGMVVQKTGAATGYTSGTVISKMLMVENVEGCQYLQTTNKETKSSCGFGKLKIANAFKVSKHFSAAGDSGALVLTTGPCPQPIGMVFGGTDDYSQVESIGSALQALKSAGGYSSLTVVPGGAGCTPTTAEVQDENGNITLEDPTVPDPDVAQALVVLPDLTNDSGIQFLMLEGDIDGIGIDLSGSTAALDVIVDSSADLDPYNIFIPASFEGVKVEQDVIETIDASSDDSDIGSFTN